MIKVLISGQRTSHLSRIEFHEHLLHHHAPLVKSCSALEPCVLRYVQNHVKKFDDVTGINPVFNSKIHRDSVIELWCNSSSSLKTALSDPEYLSTIRPDEQYFTDQKTLIVLFAEEDEIYQNAQLPPLYKCFDFLKVREGSTPSMVLETIAEQTSDITMHQRVVQRRVINRVIQSQGTAFAEAAPYEFVLESWISNLSAYAELHTKELMALLPYLDSSQSMTLYAEEFEIINKL